MTIEPHLLLSELRYQMTTIPEFCGHEVIPNDELEWLGKASALVERWNTMEAVAFRAATKSLGIVPVAQLSINEIKAIMYRAIADLELQMNRAGQGGAFGPGAVYDFFTELNKLVAQASQSLFVIDPYMDSEIFDQYLSSSSAKVDKQLLVSNKSANLKSAAQKFVRQNGGNLEIRESPDFHDRLIIIDSSSVWVLGQSIKDAAKKKPTYLAPLAVDICTLKMQHYSKIWQSATPI